MAIFNSYVKLPEGTIASKHLSHFRGTEVELRSLAKATRATSEALSLCHHGPWQVYASRLCTDGYGVEFGTKK